MYIIPTSTSESYVTNDSLNNLIEGVDAKLLLLAVAEYNNRRLGLKSVVDLCLYDDLQTYRYILLNKLLGCNCLSAQFLIFIVSRVKKLIR
jgi:hypothetical protein